MSPTINAVRLGIARGWIEFKMFFLKNPQGLISTLIFAILLIGVLWFERTTKFEGVSLAILTLPGLLGMLIANEGLSSIAKLLSYDREDGTLLRAKAIPQGMVGYLIARGDDPSFNHLQSGTFIRSESLCCARTDQS